MVEHRLKFHQDEIWSIMLLFLHILAVYCSCTCVYTGIGALHDIQSQPTMSLWSLDVPLKIKVTLATYVNVRDRGEVRIQLLMLLTSISVNFLVHALLHTMPSLLWCYWLGDRKGICLVNKRLLQSVLSLQLMLVDGV